MEDTESIKEQLLTASTEAKQHGKSLRDFDEEGNPICPQCGEHLVFAGNKIRKLLLRLLQTL